MTKILIKENKVSGLAQANDSFRRTGSGFTLTPGTMDLPDVCGLINAVQKFDEFDDDNDPYAEHDFGSLDWEGRKVFWKIDYFDPNLKRWEDPTSPECHRVLTVMLAEEY